ncbi:MAG: hypothetical protein HRU09_04315 [Oligoflexales bacterium]|nr:hypothetical protein [Oligoflexales bacterium]
MKFRSGFRFFPRSWNWGFLAMLLVLSPILNTVGEAKDVGLSEVIGLPPMPVSQILDKYAEKSKATEPSSATLEASTRKAKSGIQGIREGEDYKITSLLSQEPVILGEWLKSLGSTTSTIEKQELVEGFRQPLKKDADVHPLEGSKHRDTSPQKVVIRVQGEQKSVSSKVVEIDQPAASAEQLAIYAPKIVVSTEQADDETSEFLSSYLSNFKGLSDALSPEPEPLKDKKITVSLNNGRAEIDPKEISGEVGDVFLLSINSKEPIGDAKFVVRNPELLSWEPLKMQLKAEKEGRSEFILSLGDQMLFLPVDIHGEAPSSLLANLSAPPSVVGFNSVEVHSAKQLSLNARISEGMKQGPSSLGVVPFTPLEEEDGGWKIKQIQTSSPYIVDRIPVAYDKVRIQLIDEQSILEKKELRPAVGVQLKILGTQYAEDTDAKGMGSYINVPRGSRFLVETSDKSHYYAPSIVEVHSPEPAGTQPIRIKLMQRSLLHHLREIHGVKSNPYHASLCGVAVDQDRKPIAGVHAFAKFDGYSGAGHEAIYFSETGFPGEAKVTGPDGRFCFLAVEEGPLLIDFSKGTEHIGTIPVSAFSGKHLDLSFPVYDQRELKTHLTSLPHAKDIDLLPPNDSDKRKMVDMVNLRTVSDVSLLQQLDYGYVAAVEPLSVYNGRACYMNESSEFEYAYYCQGHDDQHVTSLLPNGFMNAILNKYNMRFQESGSGSVLIEHGAMLGREHDSDLVVIELIDSFGRQPEDRALISDKPTTRAAFYNVRPGTYTVITKTSQGFWLDMDTITVYSDTTSYLRTGSQVRFNPNKLAAGKVEDKLGL